MEDGWKKTLRNKDIATMQGYDIAGCVTGKILCEVKVKY